MANISSGSSEHQTEPKASPFAVHHWLPITGGKAFCVSIIFIAIQFAFFLLPWLLSGLGWEYPWGIGLWTAASQSPFLALMLVWSLITASSLRRLMSISSDNWFVMLALGGLAILLTCFAYDIKDSFPKALNDKLEKFEGLNIWINFWLVTSILAMKPVFDHMLDLMHPRPSALNKSKIKRKHISRT